MKAEFAKTLCSDIEFTKSPKGTTVCKHKGGRLCNLQDRTICELVRYREAQTMPVKIESKFEFEPIDPLKPFAKKICSDLDPYTTRTGESTCKHKVDGRYCDHDNHFVCELDLFDQRSLAKRNRGGVEAISPSRIGVLDACARKYAFIYVHKLREMTTPIYFLEGSAFSNARAKIDMEMDWGMPDNLPETSYRKIKAALRFYQKYPPYEVGSVVCEEETVFEHDGEHFIGYLDAISHDRKTIYEWKYALQPYDVLKGARQAAVYFHNFEEAQEFHLITFAKPSHKPSKAKKPTKKEPKPQPETMQQFEDRVFKALEDKGPELVYRRVLYKRNDSMVMSILNQMNAKFRILPVLKNADWPPSYKSCQNGCDYTKYCAANLEKSTTDIAQVIQESRKG